MNNLLAFISTIELDTLLLTGSLLLLLINVIGFKLHAKPAKQTEIIKALQRDMRALTSAALGMGERVQELERRQRSLAERQDKQSRVDLFEPANQPYEHAIKMVQQGAKTEDLVKSCGLSTSEAELINMMHRLDKAS